MRVTATSDRYRQTVSERAADTFVRRPIDRNVQAAARSLRPRGISPVVTMRHSAISNLRASATIIVLRVEPRASAVRL
jgi:hypothetical protein